MTIAAYEAIPIVAHPDLCQEPPGVIQLLSAFLLISSWLFLQASLIVVLLDDPMRMMTSLFAVNSAIPTILYVLCHRRRGDRLRTNTDHGSKTPTEQDDEEAIEF